MDELRVVQDLIGAVPHVQPPGGESKPHWLARRAALIRANAVQSGAVRLDRPKRTPRRGLLSRIKSGTVRAFPRD